ncbi:hypothetical protein PtA15_6A534 [Puccinia triticina]|uniref:Uncharacterized protein n=1 Tax=Puccinia triticina TaxID=208348 RepID=A0ABY7CMH1_9BASI|nr:uncharacterized protein PtA15_6A534 [Puccinia triticina]WAQ85905.1 hypothetical protein PtA15_6A534 [Puccinia triticina]
MGKQTINTYATSTAVGGAIAAPYLGCPSSESEVLAGTGTGYWSLRVHCRSPLASP